MMMLPGAERISTTCLAVFT